MALPLPPSVDKPLLICGDWLEVAPTLPAESVDAAVESKRVRVDRLEVSGLVSTPSGRGPFAGS